MKPPHILIVDDEPDLRWVLQGIFKDAGYSTQVAGDGNAALECLKQFPADVILSDIVMPDMDGRALLREVQSKDSDLPVILLSALEDIETVVEAMRDGAFDYLAKPFERERLLVTTQRAVEQRQLRMEVAELRGQLQNKDVNFGPSRQAQDLDRTVSLVAKQGILSVLLIGESGTGKEVVAREIHRRSDNAAGPFVAVDCGALPEQLMESQLFGHVKGAFTGADRNQPGLFCTADGGTLFLDELGNLPLNLQSKLLRALQERQVVPVGGGKPVAFNARLLAASNANLIQAIDDGTFRLDLYHRIAEFEVNLQPLRQRPEDILDFAKRFLHEANQDTGRRVETMTQAAEQALIQHPWPGNLRELRNVLRRAVVTCNGTELDVTDLWLRSTPSSEPEPTPSPAADLPLTERIRQATDSLEASIIQAALQQAQGNKAAAARALQIDYTTLHRKLKKHGLLPMAELP